MPPRRQPMVTAGGSLTRPHPSNRSSGNSVVSAPVLAIVERSVTDRGGPSPRTEKPYTPPAQPNSSRVAGGGRSDAGTRRGPDMTPVPVAARRRCPPSSTYARFHSVTTERPSTRCAAGAGTGRRGSGCRCRGGRPSPRPAPPRRRRGRRGRDARRRIRCRREVATMTSTSRSRQSAATVCRCGSGPPGLRPRTSCRGRSPPVGSPADPGPSCRQLSRRVDRLGT